MPTLAFPSSRFAPSVTGSRLTTLAFFRSVFFCLVFFCLNMGLIVGFALPALAAAPPTGENAYCGKGNVAHFGDKDGVAELPKSCYYTALDGTPSPG